MPTGRRRAAASRRTDPTARLDVVATAPSASGKLLTIGLDGDAPVEVRIARRGGRHGRRCAAVAAPARCRIRPGDAFKVNDARWISTATAT
jgi:hypothetical protein